ncbi:MAG TPA: hypothetical protein PKK00_11165 [Bacteroidales bacterium]|nr:hypothetical protein [Bacteroidales bacterium]HPS17887.1 hypothetical protein [Bacteroidales bacterium]
MKTSLSILLTAATVFCFTANLFSQSKKPFQGTISYDITCSGKIEPAMKSQLPTTEDVTVKDCKTKTEVTSAMASQAKITDGNAKKVISLIDYMGNKFAIISDSVKLKEEFSKVTISVNKSDETKTIAGYTCKKAIVSIKDEEGSVINDTIYYTEEIGCSNLNFSTQYKDIPGAVLEYSIYIDQIEASMKYTAREVKKSKVSDNIFLIPSDYKEVTEEELKKQLGM